VRKSRILRLFLTIPSKSRVTLIERKAKGRPCPVSIGLKAFALPDHLFE
jgi:hypothetical protein